LPRYEARRVLPGTVHDVWAVLEEPGQWPAWWPGIGAVEPTVRRALAPGAMWRIEGTNKPSVLRRPELTGTLLVLEVVPQRRIVFQLSGERAEVELELAPHDDGTTAVLAIEAPRFGGVRRTFPSKALAGLAALVRPPAG
jgi:uncharacterized protein YndB with AHSA1/START domain